MPTTKNGTSLKNITYNSNKVKKWYHDGVLVFSAGALITYNVDTGSVYSEEIDSGADALTAYKTFTPTKSGWTLAGWRNDTSASSSILSSKIVDADPFTIYAVFKKVVTVTYYNNSTTASSTSQDRYYNNGNSTTPSFTLTQASKSGWTAIGWSTSTSAEGSIMYNNAASFTRESNIVLYGIYQMICTLNCISYNNTNRISATHLYNSEGSTIYAKITIPEAVTMSGWTCIGWRSNTYATATPFYQTGDKFPISTNDYTIYAIYTQSRTASFNGNNADSGSTGSVSGTACYNSAGNTSKPSITLPANGFTKTGYSFVAWAAGSASGTQYAAGKTYTLTANTTFYAVWKMTSITFTLSNGSSTSTFTVGPEGNSHTGTAYAYWYNNTGEAVTLTISLTCDWTYSGEEHDTGYCTIAVNDNGPAYGYETGDIKLQIDDYYWDDAETDSITLTIAAGHTLHWMNEHSMQTTMSITIN